MANYRRIDTTLISAKRLASSLNGNPRWEFRTTDGVFRTAVDTSSAYKGMPDAGEISLVVDGRKAVIDYGWARSPLTMTVL